MYTSSVGMNKKPAFGLQIAGITGLYIVAAFTVITMSATQIQYALQCLPASWTGISVTAYKWIVLLLLAGNAVITIMLLLHHSLIELRDYRPGMYYLLLHILIPDSVALPNMLVESMFLFILLPRLLTVNSAESRQDSTRSGGFVFGFFCGLLTLIYPPFIVLTLLWFLVNLYYRNLSVRTFMLPVMGLGLTIIYAWAYTYITGTAIHFTPWQFRWQGVKPQMHLMEYISCIILISTMCATMVQMLHKVSKIEMNRRKKWYILIINFIILLPLVLLLKDSRHLFYSTWIIIASYMLAVVMYHVKTPVLRYILILLAVIAMYVNLV